MSEREGGNNSEHSPDADRCSEWAGNARATRGACPALTRLPLKAGGWRSFAGERMEKRIEWGGGLQICEYVHVRGLKFMNTLRRVVSYLKVSHAASGKESTLQLFHPET